MEQYILGIGTAMIDIYGTSNHTKNVCNPGSVKLSFGGVARNIVENLCRINIPTKFMTVFGEDKLGTLMKEELSRLKCDIGPSLTVPIQSASFMGILNENNELIQAIADSHIMKYLTIDYLKTKKELINNAAYIVFDTNDYKLYDEFIKDKMNPNIIIDPVSPVKAEKIKHLLPYFHTIKPNLKEAEVLSGFPLADNAAIEKAGKYFINKGIKNVFITLGKEGVYYANKDSSGFIQVENITVNNEVGAGDSFVAGICYGYLHEWPIKKTAYFAYSMAILNLQSEETVNQSVTVYKVMKQFEEIFNR